ncbi:ATP-binding cassette domain-containing protein, partial [Deinococcus metallilatus]
MAPLTLRGIEKRFGNTVAVQDLNLQVGDGEFFALLGPSGCGKTTTMRMIAGLEAPSAGRIQIGERDVTGLPPAE